MGKLKPSSEVDLAAATISGCLKQIRRSNVSLPENHVPSTHDVWICNIEPQHTKGIVRFIEQHIKPIDDTDFTHIKRFRKNVSENSPSTRVTIATVICPAEIFGKSELVSLLRSHFLADFDECQLFVGKVPNELPPTKELSMKWSSEIWPLAWKGNPNHQDLITAYFNVAEEQDIINQLLREVSESKGGLDIATCTIIAEQDPDSKNVRILHSVRDSRSAHILQHSIMNAIAEVARAEKQKRSKVLENQTLGAETVFEHEGYLCHNLLVYTTHEPCTMCAMALVHSRIGRLIYLKTHPLGAIESSHFIGDRRDLNWTFDIWRWVGPGASDVPTISNTVAP